MTDQHNILIYGTNNRDKRVLLAAIITHMTNSFIKRGSHHVRISMRPRGKELLFGDNETSAAFDSSRNIHNYNLIDALENYEVIPESAEISISTEDQYCGRIRLECHDPEKKYNGIDSVLIIADKDIDPSDTSLLSLLGNDKSIAVISAVLCSEPHADTDPAEFYCKDNMPELYKLASKHKNFFGWYSHYGFNNAGQLNNTDNASPYGVSKLFWRLMALSARHRLNLLKDIIAETKKIIRRRVSVYQKKSIRHQLELGHNRESYAYAIKEIYASMQLIAVAEQTPLMEDDEKMVKI